MLHFPLVVIPEDLIGNMVHQTMKTRSPIETFGDDRIERGLILEKLNSYTDFSFFPFLTVCGEAACG